MKLSSKEVQTVKTINIQLKSMFMIIRKTINIQHHGEVIISCIAEFKGGNVILLKCWGWRHLFTLMNVQYKSQRRTIVNNAASATKSPSKSSQPAKPGSHGWSCPIEESAYIIRLPQIHKHPVAK